MTVPHAPAWPCGPVGARGRSVARVPGTDAAPDAVLGYAAGCDIAEISPFIRSLRAWFPGRVILAVDRDPTLVAWLSTHGVETVPAPGRVARWRSPARARQKAFGRILQANPDIGRTIVTDVRDVVFETVRLSGLASGRVETRAA